MLQIAKRLSPQSWDRLKEILLGYLVVEEGRERDMEDSIFTWEERFEKEILGAPESAMAAPAFAAVEVEKVRRVLVHDWFAIVC